MDSSFRAAERIVHDLASRPVRDGTVAISLRELRHIGDVLPDPTPRTDSPYDRLVATFSGQC